MSKPLVRLAQADLDVIEAVDHYLEEAPEAVDALIDALEESYHHIGRAPGTGSPRYAHELDIPGLRCWRCRKHPYLVFFRELDDRVIVIRVLHERRDIPLCFDEGGGP